MRVLVACEYSGRVREAFRRRGHDAWSCDLLPAEDGSQWHYRDDCLRVLAGEEWEMMIAHPPCTHLAVSGSRHMAAKRADGRQADALAFVRALMEQPMPWAIENPVSVISTAIRRPDQIIQPWMFGHGETKATCLWLNGLAPLYATRRVCGREPRVHRMSPSPERWKERSRTYEGIAEAMAEQWGDGPAQHDLFGWRKTA